jgi:hypothetical protein
VSLLGFKSPLRCCQLILLCSLLTPQAGQARAAWHDKLLGSDTAVHYVYLTGHDGDNAINRKLLQIEYDACVDRKHLTGKQSASLSPDDIPAVPRPEEVEIYYSANRTLLVVYGKRYQIKNEDCSLDVFVHHTLQLTSPVGRCDVDLIKKQTRGKCGSNEHRQAAAFPLTRGDSISLSEEDLRKVPPHMQKQVREQFAFLKKKLDAEKDGASAPAGARKRIAGITCEVSGYASVKTEKCIARPESQFPIPASPLNLEHSGLLLEVKSEVMTLKAQKVLLHMSVSERLFTIPAGMAVMTVQSSKKVRQ